MFKRNITMRFLTRKQVNMIGKMNIMIYKSQIICLLIKNVSFAENYTRKIVYLILQKGMIKQSIKYYK